MGELEDFRNMMTDMSRRVRNVTTAMEGYREFCGFTAQTTRKIDKAIGYGRCTQSDMKKTYKPSVWERIKSLIGKVFHRENHREAEM